METRRIPLGQRGGGVRDYALLDEADYELCRQYQWFLNGSGYAQSFGAPGSPPATTCRCGCGESLADKRYGAVFVSDAHRKRYKRKHGATPGIQPLQRERTSIQMHRLIMGLDKNDPREVDHIGGNRLDNRRINLRIVDRSQNQQNRTRLATNNTSGYRGVSRQGTKWKAYAKIEGRYCYLGLHATAEIASGVAQEYRRTHMPYSAADRR